MNLIERLLMQRFRAEAGEGGDPGAGGNPAGEGQQVTPPAGQPQNLLGAGQQIPGQQTTPPGNNPGTGQEQAPAALVEKLPEANDAKGWQELYAKLGRPEKIDDYGIKPPEGADGAFLNTALGWLHENGLNKAQAANIVEKWNSFNAQQSEIAKQNSINQNNANREQVLKTWGKESSANTAIVQNAVQRFFNDAVIGKLEKSGLINDPDLVNAVLAIGKSLGEDKTVTASTSGNGSDSLDIAQRMWPNMK